MRSTITTAKTKSKLSVTKSGIPLLSHRQPLPEEYRKNFAVKGDETKVASFNEEDILNKKEVRGPRFVLNVTPFKYSRCVVITDDGKLEEIKDAVWIHDEDDTSSKTEKVNQSLLSNILYFNNTNKNATPSEINPNITFPIVKEWVRQLMAARFICCYDEDIRILLHNKTKLDVVKQEFEESHIFKFELITDKKLLQKKEDFTNGYFIRYDERKFKELIKDKLESALYIVIILNNTNYSLNYVNDNYHVISYVPVTVSHKSIIDEKLTHFWGHKGFEYVIDNDRKLDDEENRFLPLLPQLTLQEDYCMIFLRDMHLQSDQYKEKPDFNLTKSMYISYYINIITNALQLNKEE